MLHADHYDAIDAAARQIRRSRNPQDWVTLCAVVVAARRDGTPPDLIAHALLDPSA
jgi:hypothetical protein